MALVRSTPSRESAPAAAPPSVTQLLVALHSAAPDGRRQAALALAGVREATGAVAAQVGVETDPAAREAMLTALAETDSPEAVAGLIGYLRSEDAGLRSAVAETLAAMPATAVAVPGLLADADPDVRILTVMAIAVLPAPDVPGWLRAVAGGDPHANVVGAAVNELAEVGTADMADDVRAVAERFPDDPFLAFACELVARRLAEVS